MTAYQEGRMRLTGEAVDRERLPPVGMNRSDPLHRHPTRLDEIGPVGLLREAMTPRPTVGDIELGGRARAGREAGTDDVGQVDEEGHVAAHDRSARPLLGTIAVT